MTPIQIVEVGPRDGLQNEDRLWSIDERVQLINLLSACGFKEIEVGSFVSPKWVPQMAHTDAVYGQIQHHPETLYSVLVPNMIGMEKACELGCKNISIFASASESFSQKNINCSIEESYERFLPIMAKAQEQGIRVRGYVSCVVECPYEGPIFPIQVAKVVQRLDQMGCHEISLGDTIGKGSPETITALIQALKPHIPLSKLAIHCHDTFGTAIANIVAALHEGIRVVDSAIGGLGGCPYAQGQASGNVATESLVKYLPHHGYSTTISPEALKKALIFMNKTREKL